MTKFFHEYLRIVLSVIGIAMLVAGVTVTNPALTVGFCLAAIIMVSIESIVTKKNAK